MTGPPTSQPASAHPLVAVVTRLRQLHHDAPADERPGVAVLLALALTDLSLALAPNDPMLARTAAEGISVLAACLGETAAVTDDGPAAESDRLRHLRLADAVLRWRAAPTGGVDDPTHRLQTLLLQPIPPAPGSSRRRPASPWRHGQRRNRPRRPVRPRGCGGCCHPTWTWESCGRTPSRRWTLRNSFHRTTRCAPGSCWPVSWVRSPTP